MKSRDKISFQAYEEMAENYFNKVDSKPYNAYYERPGTISLLPNDLEGKRILDAGCAAGWFSKWLMEKKAQPTALDFSPKMIHYTRIRTENKIDTHIADLNDPLDMFSDKHFDIVLSSLCLHYLKDWNPVMREFHRILKSNGILVFSTHHPFMDYTFFQCEDYFEKKLLTDIWENQYKVQFYRRPLNKITSAVTNNGFVIEKIDEPLPNLKFKEKVPNDYEKLSKKPHFLFVRARKDSNIKQF